MWAAVHLLISCQMLWPGPIRHKCSGTVIEADESDLRSDDFEPTLLGTYRTLCKGTGLMSVALFEGHLENGDSMQILNSICRIRGPVRAQNREEQNFCGTFYDLPHSRD